jgi:PAS domain S-box-containing protein
LRARPSRTEGPCRDSSEATAGALLNCAVRAAGLGYWLWDLAAGGLTLSPEARELFGPCGFDGSFASWLACVDPNDAQKLQELEFQVRSGRKTFSFEYHFRGADGLRRRFKSDGEVVDVDAQGTPVMLAGTVLLLEAPPQERNHASLALLEEERVWTWEQDASYRFTALDGGPHTPLAELAGAIGLRPWELPQSVPRESTWRDHVATLERRESFRGFEHQIGSGPDAAYVSVSGDPVYGATGEFVGYRGIARNITRRARAEEAATYSRFMLQQACRLGHVGGWALRVPGMEVEWTKESQQLLGHAGSHSLSWQEAILHLDEPSRARLLQAVSDCVANGSAFSLEARAFARGGKERWLRIVGEAERSVIGPCRRVIGAIHDISEKREDARRLQELNERLTTTLESITEGFYTLDRQWRFTYVNHETERVTKRSRAELLGRPIADLYPWFFGSEFHLQYERALNEGRTAHFECFSPALGLWVEVYAYPSPQGLAVYFEDITERRRIQDALASSEERHRLFVEVSIDAILQVEHESGRIVSANAAACEMFRLTAAQMRERGRRGLVAPRETRLDSLIAAAEKTGRGGGRLTLVRGDGTEFEAEISGAIFKASDGITYASVVIRDISESLKHEAEIVALNDSLAEKVRERTAELEAANAELKAFAHSLAHDLRTPIAAVNTLAHVLEQRLGSAAERERQYASRIRQAGQQLDDYVDALLSHARISQAPIHPSRVNMARAAEAVLADLRLNEPGRMVVAHVQPDLTAYGDPTLLRLVLQNLLGNAWKFTRDSPAAQIWFSAERHADGSQTFCVRDNGAGFDMDYAHKLFGVFQRLHTQAEFPGTGIGLSNVQRIVARHGGRVWATGQQGVGASFHFSLPGECTPPGASTTRAR